jgi:hypothetical protein
VPAAFSYIDRYRIWSKALLSKLFRTQEIKKDTQELAEGKKSDYTTHTAPDPHPALDPFK